MKTLIIYYTFGGSTKKEADSIAKELGAATCQVKESHRRSILGAFIPGVFQAAGRKRVGIEPLQVDLREFDKIMIGCPIWAGYPAPAFNSIIDALPSGKDIELFFCSGGGGTPKSRQGTEEMIKSKDCKLLSYRDVFTNVAPEKMKK
ncbi:hypothetical protein SDC9_114170 [bioreactor metagenome]|uniref:Flavodoxin-like domain-containing protein n=1 Tax=bioreactor metagenome TaxID=1076179 RepID=A0A645BP48_9ZZZZ|nr:hypothetical protein [Candidatus Pelethousia sp.]